MSTDHSVVYSDGADAEHHDPARPSADGITVSAEGDDVIHAAGCVVYRHGADGPEVLVVHRPRYDDWDLPKGKREPGESDPDCARRETEEETGHRGEIEGELASDTYRVRGRDKLVRWYLMRCTDGSFEANTEVDEIRWLSPDAAREILSYGHARTLIDAVPDGSSTGDPA